MTRAAPLLILLFAPAALAAPTAREAREVRQAVHTDGYYAGEPLGVAACAGCHADVAAQWSESAHRFASFNNPYYAASAQAFRRERGQKGFVFCARCHDPALLDAGRVGTAFRTDTPEAQQGLTCLTCHSIRETHGTLGNGSFTRTTAPVPPASAGAEAHRARLRPPLLATAALCAGCHKVGLGPEVTHDIWLRGQDDYDPWQKSAVAGQGAGAVRRPPASSRCQDCHMPLEPAVLGDLGAHEGRIRSHRFLAANSALPSLRGDPDATARLEAFLRGAVSVDVFARRAPGGALLADVVVRNRRTGHRFPGGVGDSNEAWLEVEVLDRSGAVLAQNGGLGEAGDLDGDAHLLRAQPVDAAGRPLARRDPQHARGVVYDTSISPADPAVVRYRWSSPPPPAAGPLRVRARLRYRQFAAAYARFACGALPAGPARDRCLHMPVLQVSEAERSVDAAEERSWEAWLDYGLGLADGLVERAAEAMPSLLRARALAPSRVEPVLGLARLALAEGRTADVFALAGEAERLAPDHPAPLWLRAQALVRVYREAEARPVLERLAVRLPGDRDVWVALGRARDAAGDHAGALAAADRVIAIDAESADGHHLRMVALRGLGRVKEADRAGRAYLTYRRRTERDLALRARFAARFPERAEEATPVHEHVLHAPTVGVR